MVEVYPVVRWPLRLKRALELLPPGAPPCPVPVVAPKRRPRWPWLVGLGLVVAAGLILSGVTGLWVGLLGVGLLALGYSWEAHQYHRQCQNYQVQHQQYLAQKQAHETWLAEHADAVRALRQPKIHQALRQVVAHPQAATDPKPGVTEAYFYEFLRRYFPGHIHIHLALADPIKTYKKPYEPDFVYLDENLNLYIDIEIDEPYFYDAKSGQRKPHHIRDQKRDEFFLAAGWVVIRFSEYQVVRQPKSCCKWIASVIAQIHQTPLDDSWASIPDLEPEPLWDETRARQFIQQRSRYHYLQQYLPKEYLKAQWDYIMKL
ncbi:hypothetical protein [Gloeomargarita sp.]